MADMTGMDEGWLEESHYKMSKKIAQLTRVPALDPWIQASMFAAWKRFCHVSALLCSFLCQ